MVVVLDPSGEFFVEYSDVGEVESTRQKALSDGAEEALDLPLAAPSRMGAWQSKVPMRAQIWVISLEV